MYVFSQNILLVEGFLDIDVKDLTTRYTNDVIASCAFGLKVDSHMDVDNQFYAMGKTAMTFKFRQLLMFFLMMSFPKVVGVSIFKNIPITLCEFINYSPVVFVSLPGFHSNKLCCFPVIRCMSIYVQYHQIILSLLLSV